MASQRKPVQTRKIPQLGDRERCLVTALLVAVRRVGLPLEDSLPFPHYWLGISAALHQAEVVVAWLQVSEGELPARTDCGGGDQFSILV